MKTLTEIKTELAARNVEIDGVQPGQTGYATRLDQWASERFESEKEKEITSKFAILLQDFKQVPPSARNNLRYFIELLREDPPDYDGALELLNNTSVPQAWQATKTAFITKVTELKNISLL